MTAGSPMRHPRCVRNAAVTVFCVLVAVALWTEWWIAAGLLCAFLCGGVYVDADRDLIESKGRR